MQMMRSFKLTFPFATRTVTQRQLFVAPSPTHLFHSCCSPKTLGYIAFTRNFHLLLRRADLLHLCWALGYKVASSCFSRRENYQGTSSILSFLRSSFAILARTQITLLQFNLKFRHTKKRENVCSSYLLSSALRHTPL